MSDFLADLTGTLALFVILCGLLAIGIVAALAFYRSSEFDYTRRNEAAREQQAKDCQWEWPHE